MTRSSPHQSFNGAGHQRCRETPFRRAVTVRPRFSGVLSYPGPHGYGSPMSHFLTQIVGRTQERSDAVPAAVHAVCHSLEHCLSRLPERRRA